MNPRMPIVIAGHVDHGKSTILGRLLADTQSLPQGKLDQVRETCRRNAKPFEYAFLLDALKDEQAQGITIDSARVFFATPRRQYVIVDAPGHIEFVRNMVTGAARAEAALLVIDAQEGVQENSRRHGYLLSLLGIRQLAILVNKMDLVGYSRAAFDAVVNEYQEFLGQLALRATSFIPVSGREGENLARRSASMPWYDGPTVLEALDAFQIAPPLLDKPFRMPVQDVYKFTGNGDDRRIVAGTVESGIIRTGDEVLFYPSGKRGRVRSIEAFGRPPGDEATAGHPTGFTLEEQLFIPRGEVATRSGQPRPQVTSRLRASLFWLGKAPLQPRKDYLLKLGTSRVPARVEQIHRVIDSSDLRVAEGRESVDRHEAADCSLVLSRAIAFDAGDDLPATSRFVLVDDHEIRGGGVVREALPDRQARVRDKVMLRNSKWEPSLVPRERRAERYGQKPSLLLVTGDKAKARKQLAKDLERHLFEDGRVVHFLGIANVLYGIDSDIERTSENRREHLRRLAEVANIMLDAGIILIVSAAELTQDELELFRATVDPDQIETIWTGDRITTSLKPSLFIGDQEVDGDALAHIKALLRERGVIFQPW